jgi:hypothetical protein
MPNIEEVEKAIPSKSAYRVVGVGVTYRDPQAVIGPDGQPQVVYNYAVAGRAETVQLTEWEARRLEDTGTIKPADAERTYDEMGDDELEAMTTERAIDVRGSAADGSVRREDRINALLVFDQGATAGTTVGITTVPGGVAEARPGTSDGPRVQTGVLAPTAPDPAAASTEELAEWIKSGPEGKALTAEETVALAQSDPARAEAVLEAERAASEGDARKTVVERLERLRDSADE